jgi:hypothetical protein
MKQPVVCCSPEVMGGTAADAAQDWPMNSTVPGGVASVAGGYDEGYGGGLTTSGGQVARPLARAKTPVNDLDDDIPF